MREVAQFWYPKEDILFNKRPDFLEWKNGRNLELDIWIPKLNVAFEVNGIHHQSLGQKERDRFKKIICEQKGIDLIIIPNHFLIRAIERARRKLNLPMLDIKLKRRLYLYRPKRGSLLSKDFLYLYESEKAKRRAKKYREQKMRNELRKPEILGRIFGDVHEENYELQRRNEKKKRVSIGEWKDSFGLI